MGEWSKKIGEYGEDVVYQILSLVGWSTASKGKDIPCVDKENHAKNGTKERIEHGIDYMYTYMSPLVSGQLVHALVSSKYSTNKYPNSPNRLVREYTSDLVSALDCFDGSKIQTDIDEKFEYSSSNDVGVLFWLNNIAEEDDDLIQKISSIRLDANTVKKSLYIIDNKRAGFILQLMLYIKANESNYDYDFYYPNTGLNINPIDRKNVGKILPIEYFNSPIIPIKLTNNKSRETSLFLGILDNFESDSLIRLIGLAKDITTELTGKVIIGFHDYNRLNDEGDVSTAKQQFQDDIFTKSVKIINYTNPLDFLIE